VRVLALGSDFGDDSAALRVAARIEPSANLEVIVAGRPGPSLLDWFEPGVSILLLDVVRRGISPGELITLPLRALVDRGLASGRASSHDLGPVDALRLSDALGRPTPEGLFVGLGGVSFSPQDPLSEPVRLALDAFEHEARAAIHALRSRGEPCTNTA
jgi:hydrogenase maturation protease